ncbi:hypothetical protein E2C01_041584 [Portunus trituberculatus]|uniref:Uncharacterized protein n=1 Tax=Portunus trituberculatus TaxID=210409 RepID=A0A5B7FQR8_PORTR|nr:hypothetical protein [Portunus trituberculatus]
MPPAAAFSVCVCCWKTVNTGSQSTIRHHHHRLWASYSKIKDDESSVWCSSGGEVTRQDCVVRKNSLFDASPSTTRLTQAHNRRTTMRVCKE